MQSEHKFNRWIFAAVYAFLALQSLAESDSQEFRKVLATGAGLDTDGALKNAFKVAVEEAIGTLVDTETIVREDDTIQEKILTASNGFIKSYDLIRQWKEGGLYRCRIEALVEIRELKQSLAAANISTFAVSGTSLAARVQTEKSSVEDAAAILGKHIIDFPNRVLRIQKNGEPDTTDSKQEGVTRLKIPIIVFVDQAAYRQEVSKITAALDKLALEKVSGNLQLLTDVNPKAYGDALRVKGPAGVELLPTDRFYETGSGFAAAEALSGLFREAQQKFGALPEKPGIVTVMSELSKTGTTRFSLYAVNKAALGSLTWHSHQWEIEPCKIKVTVQLVDASGSELDSSEHSLVPDDGYPFVLDQGRSPDHPILYVDNSDVRIWPGLRTYRGLQISTSWAGDAYADIETEKLTRLKGVKLSVMWITAMPVSTPTPALH